MTSISFIRSLKHLCCCFEFENENEKKENLIEEVIVIPIENTSEYPYKTLQDHAREKNLKDHIEESNKLFENVKRCQENGLDMDFLHPVLEGTKQKAKELCEEVLHHEELEKKRREAQWCRFM